MLYCSCCIHIFPACFTRVTLCIVVIFVFPYFFFAWGLSILNLWVQTPPSLVLGSTYHPVRKSRQRGMSGNRNPLVRFRAFLLTSSSFFFFFSAADRGCTAPGATRPQVRGPAGAGCERQALPIEDFNVRCSTFNVQHPPRPRLRMRQPRSSLTI